MTQYRRHSPIENDLQRDEVVHAIWMLVARQDCRISAREIGEKIGVATNQALRRMVLRGQIHQIPVDSNAHPFAYAVTSACRVPRGLTVGDILAAVAPDRLAAAAEAAGEGPPPLMFKPYQPVPGSLPWRLCKFFAENPDVVLSRLEIRREFAVPEMGGVEGNIVQAIVHGAIRRVPGPGRRIRWGKGPSSSVVLLEMPGPKVAPPVDDKAQANNPFNLRCAA